MDAIFQKRGKEMLKESKTFENLGKNVQNLKILEKQLLSQMGSVLLEGPMKMLVNSSPRYSLSSTLFQNFKKI